MTEVLKWTTVKQAIGQSEVLPWSRVWKKDDPVQTDHLHKAPQGGLIIHWVMSSVVIAGASSVPSTLESVNLPGYIQTYSHCFILSMFLGSLRSLQDPPVRQRGPNCGPLTCAGR
jgi:hypothetical protein